MRLLRKSKIRPFHGRHLQNGSYTLHLHDSVHTTKGAKRSVVTPSLDIPDDTTEGKVFLNCLPRQTFKAVNEEGR